MPFSVRRDCESHHPTSEQAFSEIPRNAFRSAFTGSALRAAAAAVAVLLLVWHLASPPWAAGQRQPQETDGLPTTGSLWLWMSQRDNDPQQILVAVDRDSRHAAVYHVDASNGTITLRSTRNLAWDLLVDDFNGREPSPEALKNMLETDSSLH